MRKDSWLAPLVKVGVAASTALLISACSSNAGPQNVAGNGSNDNFMDASVDQLYQDVEAVYKTKYFALGIPKGWHVLSFSDEDLASSIAVERDDRSALVTVRVTKASAPNIEESCKLALAGYEANGLELEDEDDAGVQYGTCIIEGKDNGKESVLWLRQYDDDNSTYSISYTGELSVVSEILVYLVGNNKTMQLLARPL